VVSLPPCALLLLLLPLLLRLRLLLLCWGRRLRRFGFEQIAHSVKESHNKRE